MADFIGFEILGNKDLARKLERFPEPVQDAAIDEVTPYLINQWQLYPPRKRVTRRKAYGRTFDSAKQRRYFFWALNNGIITVPYRRTQRLRKGWRQVGKGRKSIIVNETPYAEYVQGNEDQQARLIKLVGWIPAVEVFEKRADKIDQKLFVGAQKELKKQGLI
jgi:hypothetical protein